VKKAKLLDGSDFVAESKNGGDEIFRAKCRVDSRLRTTFERFRLEADMAASSGLSSGKGIKVEVTSFSQDWLVRNFMSTLANTEITEPAALAKSVGAKARATLELYKNGHFSS
jgi:predicted DNA-binding transcriptional regulator YafY